MAQGQRGAPLWASAVQQKPRLCERHRVAQQVVCCSGVFCTQNFDQRQFLETTNLKRRSIGVVTLLSDAARALLVVCQELF